MTGANAAVDCCVDFSSSALIKPYEKSLSTLTPGMGHFRFTQFCRCKLSWRVPVLHCVDCPKLQATGPL